MKRFISLLLAAMLLVGVIAFTVSCAGQNETEANVTTRATEVQTTAKTETTVTTKVETTVTEKVETTVTVKDETTVTEKVETTVTEQQETTAADPAIVTTTEEPVVTTTQEPVVTTTQEPVVTTTQEPVVTTTQEPVVTTTQEPVVTTTQEPVVTTTETTPVETTVVVAGDKMPGYENVDFGGRTFYIATSLHDPDGDNNDYIDFWAESYTGDAINDAVYDRNKIIEQLYNCKIAVTEGAEGFTNDVATGGKNYIGYSTAYSVSSRVSTSWYNVLKLDIDPTASYFDQAFIRDLSVHDKLFSIAGSWSMAAKECTWIVFYNKDVYESKFEDIDIYQLVRDHKWTYDKMNEFVTNIKQDVNGDGEYKFSEESNADILGMTTTTYNKYALYYCGGLRNVDKDANGNMYCAISDKSNATDILDAANRLFTNDGYIETGYTNARLAIQNKTTLFAGEIMDVLKRMKDVEDLRVGVLPQPLYNEEQESYYHYVNNQACFLGLTTSFDNLEQLSNFLTLFAYHSQQIVYPKFIDSYKYTYASDEESGEMVDLIVNSLTYDAGYHLGFAASWISAVDTMIADGSGKYASYVKRNSKTIATAITTFEQKVDAVDDTY